MSGLKLYDFQPLGIRDASNLTISLMSKPEKRLMLRFPLYLNQAGQLFRPRKILFPAPEELPEHSKSIEISLFWLQNPEHPFNFHCSAASKPIDSKGALAKTEKTCRPNHTVSKKANQQQSKRANKRASGRANKRACE